MKVDHEYKGITTVNPQYGAKNNLLAVNYKLCYSVIIEQTASIVNTAEKI